jgi:hypothetical protein
LGKSRPRDIIGAIPGAIGMVSAILIRPDGVLWVQIRRKQPQILRGAGKASPAAARVATPATVSGAI